MKARLFGAALALCAAASASDAQTCTGGTQVQDACTKTADLVKFLSPQLSAALAGGNATLGQGGALGGFGHFVLDIRGTVLKGSLPNLDNVGLSLTGQQASTFTAEDQYIPGVSANAAIGIFKGIPLGVTRVGGIDALVTATYLQEAEGGDVKLQLDGGNLQFGFGARVGLLEESLVAPGISVTYLQRSLPALTITGNVAAAGATGQSGTIELNSFKVKTTAVRLTASKNLMFLGLSAGIGQDKYTSSGAVFVDVNSPAGSQQGSGSTAFEMTRNNMFVGVSLNLLLFKVVGELGQVSGGDAPAMVNSFGSSASDSRTYFTVGIRIGM